jgi:hypothetical protein
MAHVAPAVRTELARRDEGGRIVEIGADVVDHRQVRHRNGRGGEDDQCDDADRATPPGASAPRAPAGRAPAKPVDGHQHEGGEAEQPAGQEDAEAL